MCDEAVIRSAEERDMDAIGDLWTQMMLQHEAIDRRIWQRAPDGSEKARRWFTEALAKAGRHLIVAECDGRVVGFAHGLLTGNPPPLVQQVIGSLTDLMVAEQQRRRGIGRRLADAMFAWFRERGAVGVKLSVAERNAGACGFWAATGTETYMRVQWLDLVAPPKETAQ